MINELHARFHRPEKGWDPVPAGYAAEYAAHEWGQLDLAALDEIESLIGGFQGKSVLDLGGGPGHCTVNIARRGGLVTWHDVSRNYLELSRRKTQEAKVADRVTFSLGYLDEAPRLISDRFDLVFNRICWNYGFADASFAGVIFEMTKPGGYGYVDTTHSGYKRSELSLTARVRTWVNDTTGIKIGHPMPPRGRLARLFLDRPVQRLHVDHRSTTNDRIFFQKAETPQ